MLVITAFIMAVIFYFAAYYCLVKEEKESTGFYYIAGVLSFALFNVIILKIVEAIYLSSV